MSLLSSLEAMALGDDDCIITAATFDSTFLIALRLLVKSPDGEHAARLREKLQLTRDQVAQLCDFRHRYACVLSSDAMQEEQEASGLRIWHMIWEFMEEAYRANDKSALYVPPIYSNAQLHAMIHAIYSAFRRREVLTGVFPTGHPVISGVEGTGKTTVAKAIAIAAAICSPNMLLLFANYKGDSAVAVTQWTVLHLLRELFLRYRTVNVDGAFGHLTVSDGFVTALPTIDAALARLQHRCDGLHVGIIADEVQHVVKLDAGTLDARKEIMAGLQAFARLHPNTFLVLIGSSADLRRCLVAYGRLAGYEGFPDFNHDQSRFFTVSALRSVREVQEYFLRRYGRDLNTEVASVILYKTGGVGRWMHDARDPRASAFPDRSAESLRLPSLFHDDSRLRAVLQCLREYQFRVGGRDLAADARNRAVLLPEHVRMPIDTLMKALPSVSESDIGNWVDLSILYRHTVPADGGSMDVVELAIPIDAVAHFAINTIEPQAYTRLLFSHEMIHGTDVFLAAGNQFEALMRPRVTHLLPVPTASPAADTDFIEIHADGLLYMHTGDSPAGICVTADNAALLAARTWRWKRETGLDAVQFEWDAATSTLTIHGWQCKGGRAISKLGGGSPAAEWKKLCHSAQARLEKKREAVAAETVGAPDVQALDALVDELDAAESTDVMHASEAKLSLPGFMVKAAIGCSRLALAVLRSLPDTASVRIGTFVLTASVTEGSTGPASKLANTTPSWTPTDADRELLGFSAAQWERCTWVFRTTLILGVEWIPLCLEPELRLIWERSTPYK